VWLAECSLGVDFSQCFMEIDSNIGSGSSSSGEAVHKEDVIFPTLDPSHVEGEGGHTAPFKYVVLSGISI
jgi:hypothetical protein